MESSTYNYALAPRPSHGDEPTFDAQKDYNAEQVFHELAPRVYSLARRMLRNDADAEDVTQEVLLQIVRKLATFRGESKLSTWLHRVTVNAVLEHRRQRARRPERRLDASLDRMPAQPHASGEMPDRKALRMELRRHLELAISGLPTIYRDVFVIANIENLGNAEIGKLLGLSLPAVKSRLHRARVLVRDAIGPYMEAGGGSR
jgi:RNA polymerase sigma-70 factor (ECF subfamily)